MEKKFGDSKNDWAILCTCGHVNEEHNECTDYDIDQPCWKENCSCKKMIIATDNEGNVLYNTNLK